MCTPHLITEIAFTSVLCPLGSNKPSPDNANRRLVGEESLLVYYDRERIYSALNACQDNSASRRRPVSDLCVTSSAKHRRQCGLCAYGSWSLLRIGVVVFETIALLLFSQPRACCASILTPSQPDSHFPLPWRPHLWLIQMCMFATQAWSR